MDRRRTARCPTCGEEGATVDRVTLKALLTPDGLRGGVPAKPRYCPAPDCPIVYFDVDEDTAFTESDVVVRVYAKHAADPDVPVCYCFGVNVGAMSEAERGRELREMVTHEIQAGQWVCEAPPLLRMRYPYGNPPNASAEDLHE